MERMKEREGKTEQGTDIMKQRKIDSERKRDRDRVRKSKRDRHTDK